MEQVIQFLEEYWGVSIAGGVTLGTLITFIVVQVKAIIAATQGFTQVNGAANLVNQTVEKYNQLDRRYKQVEAKNEYLEQVNLATFKALSYLVVASKLPIEDKLALQQEFAKLNQPIVKEAVTPATKEEKKEAVAAVTNTAVKAIVEATGDLLTKYVGTK